MTERGFTSDAAETYDGRIQRLVPGYRSMQDIALAVLNAKLHDTATILICGAGTGAELSLFAEAKGEWRFVAVDPSEAMLEAARRRAEEQGFADRVEFICEQVESASIPSGMDAAVSLLVTHFLADDGTKGAYLQAIANCLKPGGALVLVDHAAPEPLAMTAYQQWALGAGNDPAAVDEIFRRVAKNWHTVTLDRMAELFSESGFGSPSQVFQAFGFRGVVCRNKS